MDESKIKLQNYMFIQGYPLLSMVQMGGVSVRKNHSLSRDTPKMKDGGTKCSEVASRILNNKLDLSI